MQLQSPHSSSPFELSRCFQSHFRLCNNLDVGSQRASGVSWVPLGMSRKLFAFSQMLLCWHLTASLIVYRDSWRGHVISNFGHCLSSTLSVHSVAPWSGLAHLSVRSHDSDTTWTPINIRYSARLSFDGNSRITGWSLYRLEWFSESSQTSDLESKQNTL